MFAMVLLLVIGELACCGYWECWCVGVLGTPDCHGFGNVNVVSVGELVYWECLLFVGGVGSVAVLQC